MGESRHFPARRATKKDAVQFKRGKVEKGKFLQAVRRKSSHVPRAGSREIV